MNCVRVTPAMKRAGRSLSHLSITQMNLGAALASLGERESGTDKLNEAVAAYREALKEYTEKVEKRRVWSHF